MAGLNFRNDIPRKIQLEQLENGEDILKILKYFEAIEDDIENGSSSTINLDDYRKKTEKIDYSDLTDDLKARVDDDYDDSYVRNKIANILEVLNRKLDACALDGYRLKIDPIQYGDLSIHLQKKIDLIEDGYVYDDTEIRNTLEKKSDKVDTGLYSGIDPRLQMLVADEGMEGNIVNAVNFLFQNAMRNKAVSVVRDFGLVSNAADVTGIDYGSVAHPYEETSDMGILA